MNHFDLWYYSTVIANTRKPTQYSGMYFIHSQYAYITSDLISFIPLQTDWLKTSKKKKNDEARKNEHENLCENRLLFYREKLNQCDDFRLANKWNTHTWCILRYSPFVLSIDVIDGIWIWNRSEWQQERSIYTINSCFIFISPFYFSFSFCLDFFLKCIEFHELIDSTSKLDSQMVFCAKITAHNHHTITSIHKNKTESGKIRLRNDISSE